MRTLWLVMLALGIALVGGCSTAPTSPEGKAALSRDVTSALARARVRAAAGRMA